MLTYHPIKIFSFNRTELKRMGISVVLTTKVPFTFLIAPGFK